MDQLTNLSELCHAPVVIGGVRKSNEEQAESYAQTRILRPPPPGLANPAPFLSSFRPWTYIAYQEGAADCSLSSYIHCHPKCYCSIFHLTSKRRICYQSNGKMAERSKALASGASRVICVGVCLLQIPTSNHHTNVHPVESHSCQHSFFAFAHLVHQPARQDIVCVLQLFLIEVLLHRKSCEVGFGHARAGRDDGKWG
jgi:hypothetical protein